MATGFELSEQEFDLFLAAARHKIEEEGLPPHDIASFMKVIKDWGKIILDHNRVSGYVAGMDKAKKAALRARLEKQLEELG